MKYHHHHKNNIQTNEDTNLKIKEPAFILVFHSRKPKGCCQGNSNLIPDQLLAWCNIDFATWTCCSVINSESHIYLDSWREARLRRVSVRWPHICACLEVLNLGPGPGGENCSVPWWTGAGWARCAGWSLAPHCPSAVPAGGRSLSADPGLCWQHPCDRTRLPLKLLPQETQMLLSTQCGADGLNIQGVRKKKLNLNPNCPEIFCTSYVFFLSIVILWILN